MSRAFTLIELLVVVTIIVVLLALLTPALDQAIYQAELAACQATQDAGATGVIAYAMGSRRHYPDRKLPEAGTAQPPMVIYDGGWYDDRTPVGKAVDINGTLNCPLSNRTDIANSKPGSFTWAQYCLWFDFQYFPGSPQAQPGSFRVGDKLGWDGDRFSVLMGDWSSVTMNTGTDWTGSSHPDRDGVMKMNYFQDDPSPFSATSGLAFTGVQTGQATWSWWNANIKERGLLDLNFAFADGSAIRFDGVSWQAGEPGLSDDDRIAKVPEYPNTDGWPNRRSQIPRR